mmetsp:Transcript_304/g.1031  ORF Transcript_304/g.1031 Transcript_304/m.1031 type:complete len:212 (-) Transcript_304:209-844(-)
MAMVEKAAPPPTAPEEGLLLGTGVAGSVRGPRGQPLLLAEPRYASAAFAPPQDEALSLGNGDITTWYPGGDMTAKAALLWRAGLARRAQTPPMTPSSVLQATPVFTAPATPAYSRRELGSESRSTPLPTLLPPPPEHRPGELCMKRGVRPPPGLTDFAERDEKPIRPPPGLSLPRGADGSDDPKGDADSCSTAASSRTSSASLIVGLADAP